MDRPNPLGKRVERRGHDDRNDGRQDRELLPRLSRIPRHSGTRKPRASRQAIRLSRLARSRRQRLPLCAIAPWKSRRIVRTSAGSLSSVMAKAMARELDRVGLVGTGTPPEPKGIFGTSGLNTVTAVGALTDYSKLLQAVALLLADNVPIDVATRSFIMSPSIWNKFESLATGITSDKTQLPRPRSLEASNFLVSHSRARRWLTANVDHLRWRLLGRCAWRSPGGIRRGVEAHALRFKSAIDVRRLLARRLHDPAPV